MNIKGLLAGRKDAHCSKFAGFAMRYVKRFFIAWAILHQRFLLRHRQSQREFAQLSRRVTENRIARLQGKR